MYADRRGKNVEAVKHDIYLTKLLPETLSCQAYQDATTGEKIVCIARTSTLYSLLEPITGISHQA
jgi:hypothetical protein